MLVCTSVSVFFLSDWSIDGYIMVLLNITTQLYFHLPTLPSEEEAPLRGRRICKKGFHNRRQIRKQEGPRELRKSGFMRHYKKPENIYLLGLVGRLLLLLLEMKKV